MSVWSVSPFARLYEAIQADTDEVEVLVSQLKGDLAELVLHPAKSPTARTQLESGKVTFSDGLEYELNKEFILEAAQLADELGLDEIAAAETLYYATESEQLKLGISSTDAARTAFFIRRQYVLLIGSWFANTNRDLTTVFGKDLAQKVLQSFRSVEAKVDDLKQQIERRRLLTQVDPAFSKVVTFKREFLFQEHQILGEILYGLVTKRLVSKQQCLAFLDHLWKYDVDDVFQIDFVPALFHYFFHISRLSKQEVTEWHGKFLKDLEDTDKVAGHPVHSTLAMVFLVYYVAWLKQIEPETSEESLASSITNPIRKAIECGALEQLMCFAAETAEKSVAAPFYDFRALLQKHIPRLIPKRLLDVDEVATKELKRALDQQRLQRGASTLDDSEVDKIYVHGTEFALSHNFVVLCSSVFSTFALDFIANSAFLLTSLRDAEEDIIVSSDTFSLDQISENADLERFYLAVFYIFSERPHLAKLFWDDKSGSAFGFLQWASQCNSPLISSAFCLLLSALSCGLDNANEAYAFLEPSEGTSGNYNRISWPMVFDSLAYYNKALSDVSVEEDPLALNAFTSVVVPELGEDSILFVAGYLQLLNQVSINSATARGVLFTKDESKLPTLLSQFLNHQTGLVGPTLTVMGSLAGRDRESKKFVWNLIEQWIFAPREDQRPLVNKGTVITNHAYYRMLTGFPEVVGFANLLSALLGPTDVNPIKPFEPLEYSFDLDIGGDNRKHGVWTYIEFLMLEVFAHSDSGNIPEEEAMFLQLPLLQLMFDTLASCDPDLLFNATAGGLPSLDNIVSGKSFVDYIQSSPAAAVLNYLYQPKVHKLLFKYASLGVDSINERPTSSPKVKLVTLAVKVIDEVLRLERFYIDEVLPLLKQQSIYYIPTDVGTHGLDSFYDALALQLPLVAEVCLYVGTQHLELVLSCVSILSRLSVAQQFSAQSNSGKYSLIGDNRLLTMVETIDETVRIRQAFIDQLEAPVEDGLSTTVKIELLQFLNNNLTPKEMTISHFLIGFNTRNLDEEEDGSIKSPKSLLNSLIYVLKSCLATLNRGLDIHYTPVRMSSLVLEILLKLMRSSEYGAAVQEILRSGEPLFMDIANLEPKVDLHAYFGNRLFDKTLADSNEFTAHGSSIGALIAFTIQRGLMLQFFGAELHSMSLSGSMFNTKKLVDALIDTRQFVAGSAKVLEFLDILEFTFDDALEKQDDLFTGYDFDYIFAKVKLRPFVSPDDMLYDFSVVDKIVHLNAIESRVSGVISDQDYTESVQFFDQEKAKLVRFLNNHLCLDNFKRQQLQALHSWVTLIQVIISDGKLDSITRSNFILEVFQCILPKIHDYLELEGCYAEELLSLCVLLLDTYEKDKSQLFTKQAKLSLDADRLYPIFKVCINGIFSPRTTAGMRSDMYILVSKYLTHISDNRPVMTDILVAIRSSDRRLLSTICNDSLMGEGSSRVTALLLLENLVKVSSSLPTSPLVSNFILDTMKKDNYLLLLAQTIKRVDAMFKANDGITLDILLYEMTIFKTSAYLLLRIAQTSVGATSLLQCGVFKFLQEADFLKVDPDLGFKVRIKNDEYVSFTLDPSASIPLYDILIPVFQLISAILISLGPANRTCTKQVEQLLHTYSKLIVGVFKRDSIETTPQLEQLTKLFTLLHSCLGTTSQSGA